MPIKSLYKYLSFFFIITLVSTSAPGGIFSAETEGKPLFVTVTRPNSSEPITVNPQVDPVLLPDETFTISAVAQPERAVNLYGWTVIPGSDGNQNPDEVITNFNAVVSGSEITFSWNPRTIFTQEYANTQLGQAGTTCENLKNHCLPSAGEDIGEESSNCAEGNVPASVDCGLPKKYTVYHDIVKPDVARTFEERSKISLDFKAPMSEENLKTTMNNTLLLDARCDDNGSCGGCEYDHYPVGWLYLRGPFEQVYPDGSSGQKPLLDENLNELEYHELNVDEENGYLPSIDGPGNTWEPNIILPGNYAPNITLNSYSSMYVFSYANFVRAYNEDVLCDGDPAINTEYTAYGFFPIKDFTTLVDGFDQYEIYALSDEDYEVQTGVTRENATLVKVLRDPSLMETKVNYIDAGLDPSQTYHFAIYEVRESGSVQLPSFLTDPVVEKQVSGMDCEGDPSSPASCNAVLGHLITSPEEIVISPSSSPEAILFPSAIAQGSSIQTVPVPKKIQMEIHEQQGSYTNDPLRSDRNGELRTGPNADEELTISKARLNRFAPNHFISGTYQSDDTEFNSDSNEGFFIGSNRAAATSFNVNTISGGSAYFSQAVDPYGVVFDSWTKQIIGDVTVRLTGTVDREQENFRSTQRTAADGLFSFLVERGKYFLDILQLSGEDNTFIFPSRQYAFTDGSDGNENGIYENCGNDTEGIFTDIYCSNEDLEIVVGSGIQHRDIPVDPPIRGQINTDESLKIILTQNGNSVTSAWSLPNGKFSFFVSPGIYIISEIHNNNGNIVALPGETVNVEADENGNPAASFDVNLSL